MPLSPDITNILTDPDVGGGQQFTVVRQRITRKLNGAGTSVVTRTTCKGNIQPAQAIDLQQMPEEDRTSQTIVIRSTFHFSLGVDGTGWYEPPDEVVYSGKTYKVNRVDDWDAWGFTTAWAILRKDVVASV